MRRLAFHQRLLAAMLSMLFACAACLLVLPAPAWAEEAAPERPSAQEQLNDLGEGNLVNVQQTPDSSFLYDVAIADLCASDASFQNKVVQVKGEVVGYAVKAEQNPGMYWITIDAEQGEKEGSLSVLVSEEDLEAVDSFGSYGTRGTILRAKGTFHVACTSHEGIMDIHADSVSAVEAGYDTPDNSDFTRFFPGMFLCVIAFVLLVVYRNLAEDER